MKKQLDALGKLKVPSRSSYFGILDLAGFKKDRFYIYQARWRPELRMAHILPHWNWPERVGQVTPVHVYTSGDEAELFLNDQSLGRKKKGAFQYRIRWDDVKYKPGALKVVAYKAGQEWATDIVKTTGPAAQVMLEADRPKISADGQDLSFITVRIADKDGLTVPRTHNLVKFSVEGPGEIVAVDNGDATSFEPFQASQRKAYNGLALVIVRAKPGQTGAITLRATSSGLQAGAVAVTAERE
jgi:beta-galactosidase